MKEDIKKNMIGAEDAPPEDIEAIAGAIEEQIKQAVWDKCKPLDQENYPPEMYRYDKNGQVMQWIFYERDEVSHGWRIEKIDPDGPREIDNLEALNSSGEIYE